MVLKVWAIGSWHVKPSIVNQLVDVCVLGLILQSDHQKCKLELDVPSLKSIRGSLFALRIEARLAPLASPAPQAGP